MTKAITNLAPPSPNKRTPSPDTVLAQEAVLLRPVLHALMLHAQHWAANSTSEAATSVEAEIQHAEADLTIGEYLERQATKRAMRSFEDSACAAANITLKALHVRGS
jgi:hypothetical protein